MRCLCAALCVVLTVGCSGFIEKRAASTTYDIIVKSMTVAKRQADIELARDAMPGGLMQLQTFALAYPDHQGFKTLNAEASCQYAIGFVFDDWEEAKLTGHTDEADRLARRLGPLLKMCVDANLALLPPAWRDARARDPDATIALLPSATRAQVPALLWIASADAVELALEPMKHLGKLGMIKAQLATCSKLAPGFHDADAELLLATLTSALSMLPGGRDGAAEFARARKLAGEGALIVDVMMARGVGVARKDRALFETTLQQVLAADLSKWPERRLSNELAKRKARRYLAAAQTLLPS